MDETKELATCGGKLIVSENLSDQDIGALVRNAVRLSKGAPFTVVPEASGAMDDCIVQFFLLPSDEKTKSIEVACKKLKEFGGPDISPDVAGFLVGLVLGEDHKFAAESLDYQWLLIGPKLLEIMERAKSLRTVEELNHCISDYRTHLNGMQDRFGNLAALFELRNGIVEYNKTL